MASSVAEIKQLEAKIKEDVKQINGTLHSILGSIEAVACPLIAIV
jgi:hypothetical protein